MVPDSMSYELTFTERQNYLYALVRAETMTLAMAMEYLRAVVDKCIQIAPTRLLLERDVPVLLPDLDAFFTTRYFLEQMKGKRIAIVNTHLASSTHPHRKLLTDTRAGGHSRLFDNFVEAEKWLLK